MSAPPLVTCIMPTANRRIFCRQWWRYFCRQSISDLVVECIVTDASDEPIAPFPTSERFPRGGMRLERMEPGTSTGKQRNHAIGLARGEFIVQFDDDEWYGPDYVHAVVHALRNADLVGIANPFIYDVRARTAQQFRRGAASIGLYAAQMGFRREQWIKHRYIDASKGDDVRFVADLLNGGAKLELLERTDLSVVIKHARNVTGWHAPKSEPWATRAVRAMMGPDARFYDEISELMPAFGSAGPQSAVQWHIPQNMRRLT